MPRERPPSGQFKLLYFASATTFTKISSETLQAPTTPKKLYDTLDEKYPGIKDKVLHSSALTINLEYIDMDADAEQEIKEGDEVAIIPPVSAG